MQPPEERTDDVSVRLEWPVQDEAWAPQERGARRRRPSPSPAALAPPELASDSSDLLPARVETTGRTRRRAQSARDDARRELEARRDAARRRDAAARREAATAVDKLATRVERLASMVERLEEKLATPAAPSVPTEIVDRLDALLGEASELRDVQERLAAVVHAREKQENDLLASANQLAEDLKTVRKQIPVSKRQGALAQDRVVERIADAVRRAIDQPAAKGASGRASTPAAKAVPRRRATRAESASKSGDATTPSRRSKRAS